MQQPLFVLRMIFDALADCEDDSQRRGRLLDVAAAQGDALQAMLDDRLGERRGAPTARRTSFAGAPAADARRSSERASLYDVVRAVIDPLDAAKPGRVRLLASARPLVNVAPLVLRRVVANVVTNAVEATEPSGAVRLTLRSRRRVAELLVDDAGDGLGHKPVGRGMGMTTSIAAILRAGGQVALNRSPLGGVQVRLRFCETAP